MRYIRSPIVVVLGLVLVTAAAVTPNAELGEAYSAIARLEARIAKLENSSTSQGQTVRAPFVVVDRDGSTILSVTGGGERRLWFGDEDRGGSVELTLSSEQGGVVSVRDATNAVRAAIIASKSFGQFRALSGSHSAYLTAEDKQDGAVVSLFAGDIVSARLRSSVDGNGSLVLQNKAGIPMVKAGVLKGDGAPVGVVSAGPGTRPGIGPSYIQSVNK